MADSTMHGMAWRSILPPMQTTNTAYVCERLLRSLKLKIVEDNQVRVMIAGAETSTVNRLASHLTTCGHRSEISTTGLECVAALRNSIPDLLILEFDILWGGGAGVLAVMDADPNLADVPVVLFAAGNQLGDFRKHPRIVARLTHPVQQQDLSSLNGLLIKIASICGAARLSATGARKSIGNQEGRPANNGRGGSIRQAAFMEPSIFPSVR